MTSTAEDVILVSILWTVNKVSRWKCRMNFPVEGVNEDEDDVELKKDEGEEHKN